MPPRKTSISQLPLILSLVAPFVGLLACANRGMEAPTEPFIDGSGGAAAGAGGSLSGAGGSLSGAGGAATGGNVGTGGSTGGTIGTSGTGGSGAGPGAGGTGGTSTGGVAGGSGGAVGTGGAAGSGGVVGSGGAVGSGGRSGTGGVGGTGGQGGAGGLSQLIVSVDFIGGRPSSGSGGSGVVPAASMAADETAGVKPAQNWNGAPSTTGTLANLHASDGSVTTATVTWNSPASSNLPGQWTNAFKDAPGDVRMMNGYLDPASPATVKVSGLPAAITGGYDVYVYGYGDIPDTATRTYQYAIGTTSFTMSQTGPSTPFSGFAQAPSGGSGDYVIFRKVTGASFTLTATPGTGTQSRAPINGIQIVWPSGS